MKRCNWRWQRGLIGGTFKWLWRCVVDRWWRAGRGGVGGATEWLRLLTGGWQVELCPAPSVNLPAVSSPRSPRTRTCISGFPRTWRLRWPGFSFVCLFCFPRVFPGGCGGHLLMRTLDSEISHRTLISKSRITLVSSSEFISLWKHLRAACCWLVGPRDDLTEGPEQEQFGETPLLEENMRLCKKLARMLMEN